LSQRTISALQRVIPGNPAENNDPVSPYRTGPALVTFFNNLGFEHAYPSRGGFPSRWAYAEENLDAINGTEDMVVAIEAAVDPAFYLGTAFSADTAVGFLNKFLEFDGFSLVRAGKCFKLRPLGEPTIAVETPPSRMRASHEFISEQIAKCDSKLSSEDYDGAITNARSLVEAVLCDIETRLDDQAPPYDGDLPKLYRRVQVLLNLDPARTDVGDSLRLVLRGLANVVYGLAPLRNKMSDAHVRTYKPARHHAKLAVNSAKTLLDFIYDTFEYQKAKGAITEVGMRDDTVR
jgi:hypothetical protein